MRPATIHERPLTAEEVEFIAQNYCRYPTKILAEKINRKYHSVRCYLYRNGMTRGAAVGEWTYAERINIHEMAEELYAQAMAGRKFENVTLKPAQPEFIAVMNAKAIERRYSVPEYSGCGSSSVIAMEAA